MKNRIIITGGCGYIGSHTVIALIEHDFEVIIIDDLSNSNEQVLERIKKITGVKPKLLNIDLKNSFLAENAFRYNKDIDAVIHFAAHKAVSESVQKPLMYYQNNLCALVNTLMAMEKYNINNFIFSSSATVYGNPKTLPIKESNETQRPFSPYGNTKKMAEEIIDDVVKANPNLRAISLRYFNPIGAHQSGMIGELPNGIPNNLMPYITQTAIGKRDKLMVFGNDYPTKDGTPIRDYIHVVDLAEAHVLALNRIFSKEKDHNLEIFNLGTGEGYSVLEVIEAFQKVTKQKLNYEITERRDGDVPKLYANVDKANDILGWRAKMGLEDMISHSWQWEEYYHLEKKN
ncbi:UDP-glucose 4-epimerase GalE [Winogradskyella schleiferi]|uniref:UDP-glucose 4-epimerase GalE n=1 Tax=Winogradskyella schleiferi TaxID=2686078 RepID=UPI0015BE295B|nr:UDP-glucose 4-epimerase GalE [Winogradskyella schleiferi]